MEQVKVEDIPAEEAETVAEKERNYQRITHLTLGSSFEGA